MGLSCGMKLAKYFLFFFNLLFWISGLALVAVAVWMRVDKSIYHRFNLVSSTEPYANYALHIILAVGLVAVIVGFVGCCGALRESKCLLGLYIVLMFIVMAGELTGGIMAVIFRGEYEPRVKAALVSSIQKDYRESGSDDYVGKSWDFVMYELQCCGASSPKDFKDSQWEKLLHDTQHAAEYMEDKPLSGVALNMVPHQTSKYLNIKGCYNAIWVYVQDKIFILIAIGLGIAGFEIFGFIIAACLCRAIRNQKHAY